MVEIERERIRFSLVLCTYNQSRYLEIVLDCLAGQLLRASSEVELILVDNNSTDMTAKVFAAAQPRLPISSRYIFEPQQGLSIARNRGVREARGETLVFTDDDARIPPEWLQTVIDTFDEYDADCVFGRILIDWEGDPPEWYGGWYQSMFVGLDYGPEILRVRDLAHEFYGKNFALRRSRLEECGGFDEGLGRVGDRLYIGEETRVYQTLVRGGRTVVYNPAIWLSHMIKEHERTVAHMRKYYRDATDSAYRMLANGAGRRILGRPAAVIRQLLVFMSQLPKLLSRTLVEPNLRNRLRLRLECGRHLQLLWLWVTDGPGSPS